MPRRERSLPPPEPRGANEALRQEIISRVQKVLSGEAVEGTRVELGGVDLPMYRRTDENRISISYPIKILTREGGKGRLIEGDLEIVGPWSKEALPPMQYQVRQLRLYRGPEAIDHPSQGPR